MTSSMNNIGMSSQSLCSNKKADIANIKEFYALIGDHVPAELYEELAALEKRLG